ncbi:SDR family oxidoreductase [Sulfitobacter geojensis]|uniref:SDR family oxidoreductase n=1 Tax=Sulfitobacter geojensis TaxID=1342299 RepID=A0AAE2W0T9_9RHOB|nr:SDR family oxidoreductase [Sulfitobacter geojensis]MBM1690741.1 SDR family oxidoreductase [Sulfitobacter geojensis]MBM1694807.1 SDR family oxidoreductase [Sulfitobacter geojensis]MBM1707039.1 SDR family oxidoreductase [Sulfitobacter geojensis]MBM1711097.1 SDR family oxidoreductase [Sulfitobacter geojensis]MBM1715163.1 SDR family oxidoreductase [Sulfitobacter geojensis]
MTKIVLITGTSTGLGVATAVQAAQAGHTVYATMRNTQKRDSLDAAARAAGVSLNVLQLDVQDTASVNAAVDAVITEQGRIDVLINNAGMGYVRSLEQAEEADIQKILDINYTGVVRCIKAVMPHMRKARAGHVINISSVGGLVGQPFNEIYCGAKFAVEGLTEAMASYITPAFGIYFTAIEPGGITSEFANTVLEQVEQTGGMLEDEYLPILQKYISGSQSRQETGIYQTADEVAEVVMKVMGSEKPPVRTRTSQWSEDFSNLKTGLDPDGLKQQSRVAEQFL